MPVQNRVDPIGELNADPDRGLIMGNRGGGFHREDQTLKDRHWASRHWIVCVLSFNDSKRKLIQPGLYTELFFLDEATALAGGHRPWFKCRREEAGRFRDCLVGAGRLKAGDKADTIDTQAAGEIQTILGGVQDREIVDPASLPNGAICAAGGLTWLKHADAAPQWFISGSGAEERRHPPGKRLTPRITCIALHAGYAPVLHSLVNG